MTEFRADLHCHSTCSDGTFTPEELIAHAASLGLQGLSITDHDNIDAFEKALPHAEKLHIRLLPGIELSASHREETIHILGYGVDTRSPSLVSFCKQHQERREKRNSAILELLRKEQIVITEQELAAAAGGGSIGRPHIAKIMIQKGVVKDLNEAFKKYLGDGKSCYAPGVRFTIEETIDVIHQADGFAILAHPHLIEKRKIVKEILDMDFDGLEGYYANYPKNIQHKWVKIGKDKGWIVTGGSDFHGTIKPYSSLGSSWTNEETFNMLY